MSYKNTYKLSGTVTLLLSSLYAFAQVGRPTVELDTLTKVIGIGLTIGGFFMGFMQMRMANKIAEVEARFNKTIGDVKDDFAKKVETETDKLETKISLSGKEIEARMATRHDIDNMKTVAKLQHEMTNLQLGELKQQIQDAVKKDK